MFLKDLQDTRKRQPSLRPRILGLTWTPSGPASGGQQGDSDNSKPNTSWKQPSTRRATPAVQPVLVPCTTPAARGQRTRCSPAGPAASLAAACCSVSPCQRDRTLGSLRDSSDDRPIARPPFTPAGRGQKKDSKSATTRATATSGDRREGKHGGSATAAAGSDRDGRQPQVETMSSFTAKY